MKNRLPPLVFLLLVVCLFCGAVGYSRHVDWPSIGGAREVRAYVPEDYPLEDAHHYTYRNFMDTWELYRFTSSPAAIRFLAEKLKLGSPATVYEFPLIVSRPPPYWWHPEQLPKAELYASAERAEDGRIYELLYSGETGIAYMIRFDG